MTISNLILCAIGVATLAALRPNSRALLVLVALGAAVVAIVARVAVDGVWLGLGATVLATLLLLAPSKPRLLSARAQSVLAGVGGGLLVAAGSAEGGSAVLTRLALFVALVTLALVSARSSLSRPDFAPRRLREESLLLLGVYGLWTVLAPQVEAGFHSAAVLNSSAAPSQELALWAFGLGLLALVAGGFAAHRRRQS